MAAPGREPPARIGRYRVEAVLGRGAMGVVYRAHDPAIDRKVAIKLVHADLLEGNDRADYVERFQREARAAGRCSHPNIVGIYDFALHDGNPYIAMEYVDGTTIVGLATKGASLPVPDAVGLVNQVLAGLGAAHALGVVHRDVKPANIMLMAERRVKVTDFGISRLDASSMTGTGDVLGTPSYMSPEQCRGEPVDARSDLFSTGVVFYELLTGTKPFAGRNTPEVMHRLVTDDPPDPAALRPDAPPALHAAIRRSLAKSPAARFASAADMAAALVSAGPGEPTSDWTVLATGPTGVDLPASVVSTLERQLARYVGPIASYLVKNALRRASTLEDLCTTLATNIEGADQRRAFTSSARTGLDPTMTASARATLSDADLEQAQRELARHVGPIARVLVKRAAAHARSVPDLWQRLSTHIETEPERSLFLKRRPAPP